MANDTKLFLMDYADITDIVVPQSMVDLNYSTFVLLMINSKLIWMEFAIWFNSTVTPGSYQTGLQFVNLDYSKSVYTKNCNMVNGQGSGGFLGLNKTNNVITSYEDVACTWYAYKDNIKYQGAIPLTGDGVRMSGMIYVQS